LKYLSQSIAAAKFISESSCLLQKKKRGEEAPPAFEERRKKTEKNQARGGLSNAYPPQGKERGKGE